MFRRKPKVLTPEQMEEIRTKDFFDMILPGNIKFFPCLIMQIAEMMKIRISAIQ